MFGIDKITKLDRSSRNTFSVALIVVMTMAMYNWIVAPHATYMSAAEQYESVVENSAKQNKIVESKLKIKEKRLQQVNKKFAPFQALLFTSDEATFFFGTQLQIILEQTGCAVTSLNFVASKKGEGLKDNGSGIKIKRANLNVVGLYGSIIKLTEQLQENKKRVWVESLTMKAFDKDSSKISCDMTVAIYTVQNKENTVNE